MTTFLTLEEVVAAHYFMMRKMDDTDQAGVKDHALLDSAIHRAQQTVFGEDAYPTLFDNAAAMLESLVRNHCFHNGNKRTAYLVVKSFLFLNGYQFRMEREFAVEFIVEIAEGKFTLESISDTVERHSQKAENHGSRI